MSKSIEQITITKYNVQSVQAAADMVACEEPLEITISFYDKTWQSKTLSITMRTPGNDEELATGFLFTEGIISDANQIKHVTHTDFQQNRIEVKLAHDTIIDWKRLERNFYTTSSCGVCGKTSIEAVHTVAPTNNKLETYVKREVLFDLPNKLRMHQSAFEQTGGLHAAALFSMDGEFIALREDVGRHNALDMLIGSMLTTPAKMQEALLQLSGRASFELIQKASMAGIPLVAAVGAPSSLAIQLAAERQITLIGFLKSDKFNCYTGTKRVL